MGFLELDSPIRHRAFLFGCFPFDSTDSSINQTMNELLLLSQTAGAEVVGQMIQRREKPHMKTYFGLGKIQELKSEAANQHTAFLICKNDLSPSQVRHIEIETEIRTIDRTELILDIFAFRAKTHTAKLQVELAQLNYILPRLKRYWLHLSRQRGGIGLRGPGESQLETDRRLIAKRISILKTKLQKLRHQQYTQYHKNQSLFRIALVGYTNAGKSTLMNAMTPVNVHTEDKLFATLDPKTSICFIDGERILITDTVGFISDLPHHLIESFRATLQESLEADLLLHVIDGFEEGLDQRIGVVRKTLYHIGAHTTQMFVFNKIDLLSLEQQNILKSRYPNDIFVSASKELHIDHLKKEIARHKNKHICKRTWVFDRYYPEIVKYIYDYGKVFHYGENMGKIKITFQLSPIRLMKLRKQIPHDILA